MLPSLRPSYYQPVTQQSILQSELISGLESRPKNTILGMKFCHRKTKIIALKVILLFIQLYIRLFHVIPRRYVLRVHSSTILSSTTSIQQCMITLVTYKNDTRVHVCIIRM